jgi:hypothetical protein
MRPRGDTPSGSQPSSRRRGRDDSLLLTAADTDRLLARRGARSEAPAVQQAIAGLLDIAAGPPTRQEQGGEVAAVAAFVLATRDRATRSARARRGRVIAACIAASAVVAFSGAATANALPAPIQELAHTTLHAPAPRPPAPLPTPPAGKPAPMPIPSSSSSSSSSSQHAKAKAPQASKAKASKAPAAKAPKAEASPKSPARAKPKGKAGPAAH